MSRSIFCVAKGSIFEAGSNKDRGEPAMKQKHLTLNENHLEND